MKALTKYFSRLKPKRASNSSKIETRVKAQEALKKSTKIKPNNRFANKGDPRDHGGILFPSIRPSFVLNHNDKVFTIGSCFARNIEEKLTGFDLPTRKFSVPKIEWRSRPNGLLNEYNPGTMAQRISWALACKDTSTIDATYAPTGENVADLFLVGGSDVSIERAKERRREIDAVYSELVQADCVIITLGLIECWHDKENDLFLNQMPKGPQLKKYPERYQFRRLDLNEAMSLLSPAFEGMINKGVNKVILSVSPVPMQASFSGEDCVTANQYSKAILRVCAQQLSQSFPGIVDYFPSYEIAMSGGLSNFADDNIHVLDEVVDQITTYMTDQYIETTG